MANNETPEWLWIIIEKIGDDERLFGQEAASEGYRYIPSFLDSDSGGACLGRFVLDPANQYELQAMRYNEVLLAAQKNQFELLVLDRDGAILISSK